MGSALLNTTPDPWTPASAEALRVQVAERLAAHRSRRDRDRAQMPVANLRSRQSAADARAARIVAAVAERYAHSQSYHAYLAAEAARAVRQAQAAAEVAKRNAEAVLAAQKSLLDQLSREGFEAEAACAELDVAMASEASALDLDGDQASGDALPCADLAGGVLQEILLWPDAVAEEPKRASRGRAAGSARRGSAAKVRAGATDSSPLGNEAVAEGTAPPIPAARGGLRIQMYVEAGQMESSSRGQSPAASAAVRTSHLESRLDDANDEAEAQALDEEIAFRQAPVFEEPAEPPMPLPANLIEFPRQLVASRKARPRLAEGPLREDAATAAGAGQLRIFEVDPAQIATSPATAPAAASVPMQQWTSIWLDAPGFPAASAEGGLAIPADHALGLPQAASIRRRVAASAIDSGIILGGTLGAVGSFILTSCHSAVFGQQGVSLPMALGRGLQALSGQAGIQAGMLLAASAVTFALLYALYQALFFSFSEATPGMRLARIALCTFAEENPARSALRRRVVAILLSACPLGLGFLWAVLDEERLTWHDRASRMYQRSY